MSSTKAEFLAMCEGCTVIVWFIKVLKELELKQEPTVVAQDNTGCIKWAEGFPAKNFTKRKHIDVKYNNFMQLISSNPIHLNQVPKSEMMVDYLCNPSQPVEFPKAIDRAQLLYNVSRTISDRMRKGVLVVHIFEAARPHDAVCWAMVKATSCVCKG